MTGGSGTFDTTGRIVFLSSDSDRSPVSENRDRSAIDGVVRAAGGAQTRVARLRVDRKTTRQCPAAREDGEAGGKNTGTLPALEAEVDTAALAPENQESHRENSPEKHLNSLNHSR